MCDLGVFPIFFRERSFKRRQNPRVDFFKARQDFEGFKTAFFGVLGSMDCLQLLFIGVEEAVS